MLLNKIQAQLDFHQKNLKEKTRRKYIEPPFSVLDTKLKSWQERRNIWYQLGIQSELGRGEEYTGYNSFGDWIIQKGWTEKGSFVGQEKKLKTSIFDPVLCELMYEWFCPKNGAVLDPFAGGSVRGIVSSALDRPYLGIDLNEYQIVSNRQQAKQILKKKIPKWIIGDSETVLDKINKKFDFIFSCPPYFNLEVYTNEEEDLSNMSDENFVNKYHSIIQKSVSKLKENSFAAFVVGEVRNKNGFYKKLVYHTIDGFEKAGCNFYNDIILLRPVANAAMRIPTQFPNRRKVVRIHQNILIFYKGEKQENIGDRFEFTKSTTKYHNSGDHEP
jgi:DNA modification methylase